MVPNGNTDEGIVLNHKKGISWCQFIIKDSEVNQSSRIQAQFK